MDEEGHFALLPVNVQTVLECPVAGIFRQLHLRWRESQRVARWRIIRAKARPGRDESLLPALFNVLSRGFVAIPVGLLTMEELADVREYDIEHLREHLVCGLLVDMNRLLGHSGLGSLGSGLDFRRRLSVRVDCDARDRIP